MFTVSSVDLPSDSQGYSPIAAIVNNSSNGVSLGNLQLNENSLLNSLEVITIPVYTGDNFTVSIPANSQPQQIIIGAKVYEITNNDTPSPGQFTHNRSTNEVTVYTSSPPESSLILNYLNDSYPLGITPTNYIEPPYDNLFSSYNFFGNLSFNRSLEGHPTLLIEGVTALSNLDDIKTAFINGTFHTIEGIKYRSQGLTVIEENQVSRNGAWVIFSVNLTGVWTQQGNTARNPIDNPTNVTPLKNGRDFITLSDLCLSNDVSYQGETITIAVEADSTGQQTTIRSEFEARAIKNESFVYYSNSNRIEARKWAKQAIHYLSEADILSEDIKKEYRGQGALYNGIPLSDEFRNTIVDFQESTQDLEDEENGNEYRIFYEFENTTSIFLASQAVVSTDGVSYRSIDNDILREPSGNANNGGFTKTYTKNISLNGQVIYKRLTKYGLAYASDDVYDVVGANPVEIQFDTGSSVSTYWRIVEQWTERTIPNNFREGYIVKKFRRGWRLDQIRKENGTDVIDAQIALTQTTNPVEIQNNNRIISQTRFKRFPVSDGEDTTLAAYRTFYTDIPSPEESDDDFIEPRFAIRVAQYNKVSEIAASTNDSDDVKRPYRTVGKIFDSETRIKIKIPESATANKRKPELFSTIQTTRNQDGSGFLTGALLKQVTENSGRPGVAQRIEYKTRNEPSSVSVQEDLSKFKYTLNSEGSGRSLSETSIGSSISYPDVNSPSEFLRIAKVDLSIRNTKNALKMRLKVRFKRGYEEGDTVIFRGESWIILGISDTRKIVRQGSSLELQSESLELDLGRLLEPPVTLSKVEVDGDGQAGQSFFTTE